jgi:hypothetical protein
MATIGAADGFGLPVSTTHVLSSGVAGTMAANHSGIQLSTERNLALAWGADTAGGDAAVRVVVCAIQEDFLRRVFRQDTVPAGMTGGARRLRPGLVPIIWQRAGLVPRQS